MIFPTITKLDILYSQIEDRLLITAYLEDRNPIILVITRGLLRNVLIHLEKLLSDTNAASGHVSADTKTEVIQMEYLGALAEKNGTEQTTSAEIVLESLMTQCKFLVYEVKLQSVEGSVVLGFMGLNPDQKEELAPLAALNVDRHMAYKLIETFYRKAEEAAWDLKPAHAWVSGNMSVSQMGLN